MKLNGSISRREFLHGFLHPSSIESNPSVEQSEDSPYSPERDYLAMLPPEFSGAMLKMEAARLGGDPATMTQNEMAALVVQALYGAVP